MIYVEWEEMWQLDGEILLTTTPLVEQMDYVLFRADKQNTCENKL